MKQARSSRKSKRGSKTLPAPARKPEPIPAVPLTAEDVGLDPAHPLANDPLFLSWLKYLPPPIQITGKHIIYDVEEE